MVTLIMSCVSTVSYYVLLNGQPVCNIKPSYGLRQGDPLSPYLFLICAMGLQSLLNKFEMEGHIQGVAICRNGPKVSHLFFADDMCCFAILRKLSVRKFLIFWLSMRGVQARKLTVRKLIYFLAPTPLMRSKSGFNKFWVSHLFVNLKNIWGCRRWWVGQKNKASFTSKRGCGKSSKGGKKNSCLRWVGKFLLSQ